jgi:hypothetical protein
MILWAMAVMLDHQLAQDCMVVGFTTTYAITD